MANVIINTKTDVAIGVYDFPGRKKPCLCIRKKGEITIYGTFKNEFAADAFVKEVAEFFGVTQEVATDTNVGHKTGE